MKRDIRTLNCNIQPDYVRTHLAFDISKYFNMFTSLLMIFLLLVADDTYFYPNGSVMSQSHLCFFSEMSRCHL